MVDLQTFNNHKCRDSSKRARNAITSTTTICQAQDDSITSHLASLSLSDYAAAPVAENTASSTRPSNLGKSTAQKLVAQLLYQLRDIESSLDSLITSTDEQLSKLGKPETSRDIFPLLCSISNACTIQTQLTSITSRAAPIQETKASLLARSSELITNLEDAKRLWNKHTEELPIRGDFPVDTIFSTGKPIFRIKTSLNLISFALEQHDMPILEHADPIIQLSVFTMVVLQVILHNSCRGCHFLLSMLHYIVQLCLLRNGRVLTVYDRKLLSDFPKDPDSATKQFKLEGKETIYAVCPKQNCQKLYPPVYQKGSPIPQYPMYCNHKVFNNKCGTRITRP